MTDPITTEVLWNTLTSYTDEMADKLEQSAYSPMIRDVRDYCAGIVDLEGRVIAYNSGGLPTHFTDLGEDTVDGFEVFGRDGFEPGDAVMMNANYVCGQHANNVLVYTPIFSGDEHVAFAVTRAHWQDIGGITANRPVFGTTDSVQEGIQVRSVKVYEGGEPNEDVLRLLRYNLRQPEVSLGDLRAQVGACRIGEQRLAGLLEEYDLDTVHEAVETVWDQSAQLAKDAVAEIPDGEYEAESVLDDDGYDFDTKVPIKLSVIVEGDQMTVDLSELADQVRGPLNSNTNVPIYIAFKALTTPHRHPDEGCLRPLDIEIPPGKIISARAPAAMGSWSWPFPTIIDTVFKALSPAIPERVAAGNAGMAYGAGFFYGTDDAGDQFVSSDILPVGWGGQPQRDGGTSGGMILGYIQDCPAEVTEAMYPVQINEYAVREGSAGAGKYRGGFGVRRSYTLHAEAFNNGEITRVDDPAWGLFGGEDGEPGYNTITEPGDEPTDYYHGYMNKRLEAGTSVTVRTGGGGGYGDPEERDPELVKKDVVDGYLDPEDAVDTYGVAVDENGEVDWERTEELRND